jgi:hypothetical protein
MQLSIARWTIEHDPEATRACYAQVSEESQCARCQTDQNYLALRETDMPRVFWELLDALGIAFSKPAELQYPEPSAAQTLHYGLWYHVVGSIVSGSDCWKPSSANGWTSYDGEEIAPGVSMGFSSNLALVDDAFANEPIVQLDFQLETPWVLDKLRHPFR